MFPYTDVEKRYRHWACLYQVLAIAFLASVGLLGAIRLITDAPDMTAALVPLGKLPAICLCCPSGSTLTGNGGEFCGESCTAWSPVDTFIQPGQDDGDQCGCADYVDLKPNDLDAFAFVGVGRIFQNRPHIPVASIQVRPDGESSLQRTEMTSVLQSGVSQFEMKKKQSGWDYAYSQQIEDRYETRQFMHAGISNAKDTFQQWATKPDINENDEVLYFTTYFRMSTGAIDRHLLLGFVPRAFGLISTLGGFFTVLGAAMSSIFKKKNADDKIARVYDERTMSCMKYFFPGTTNNLSTGKHTDLKSPHSALPATPQSFPPPGFPPPGLNHRETE